MLSCVTSFAVEFFSLFTDNAVLQRDKDVKVWGTATPDSDVLVKLDAIGGNAANLNEEVKTKADETGKWLATLSPKSAGGNYSLTVIEGDESVTIKNITFGDVWICSGQSNMEMCYYWGLTRGKEDIEQNTYKDIRLLNVTNRTSDKYESGFDSLWMVCEPLAAKNFSAVGYFFGTELYKGLDKNVPVGLIDVTWSGTRIETWLDFDSLASISAWHKGEVEKYKAMLDEWNNNGGKERYASELAAWEKSLEDMATKGEDDLKKNDFDDSSWSSVMLPVQMELHIDKEFDGLVWYRTKVELTAEQAACKDATISLGAIDDCDVTFINGEKVGSLKHWQAQRNYKIREGLLKEGENVILVQVVDNGGGGGFQSQPQKLFLKLGEDTISLAKEWKYVAFGKGIVPTMPRNFNTIEANLISACYRGMMHQLFPMTLKGAIWYQGCSNVGDHRGYYGVFKAMVNDWRKNFSGGDFPIYMVQLAPFMSTHEEPFESNLAAMRWVQTQLGEEVKNCGTVAIMDVGDHKDIHPRDKKTVGERLARMALVRTYYKDMLDSGPIPTAAAFDAENGSVVVRFKCGKGLSTSDGESLKGFQIKYEGEGTYKFVDANISEDTIVIPIEQGKIPVMIRHAWDDYPVCNLINEDGLPCGSFELKVLPMKNLENDEISFKYDPSLGRVVEFSSKEEKKTSFGLM